MGNLFSRLSRAAMVDNPEGGYGEGGAEMPISSRPSSRPEKPQKQKQQKKQEKQQQKQEKQQQKQEKQQKQKQQELPLKPARAEGLYDGKLSSSSSSSFSSSGRWCGISRRNTRILVKCVALAFLMVLLVLVFFGIVIMIDRNPKLPLINLLSANITDFQLVDHPDRLSLAAEMSFEMSASSRFSIPFRFSNGTLDLGYQWEGYLYRIGKVVTNAFNVPTHRQNVTFEARLRDSEFDINPRVRSPIQNDIALQQIKVFLVGELKARYRASKVVRNTKWVRLLCEVIIRPSEPPVEAQLRRNCTGVRACGVSRQIAPAFISARCTN